MFDKLSLLTVVKIDVMWINSRSNIGYLELGDMEISNIEKTRKRHFAFLCIGLCLPIILGFTIVDFIEGDMVEFFINIVMGMVFVAGLIGIKKLGAEMLIYRLVLTLLGVIFLYNVVIGSGNGTSVYWLFPFPLVFVFFLGTKEGGLISAIFFVIIGILLINPFSFGIYAYSLGVSLRLLASLLLVLLMACGLEASRERYGRLLFEKHEKLLGEKKHLEQALREIKTLSGLIPICSNCKKIRDDKGYWQQVEVYVRDHSEADFSHSICPDCVEKLYPGYKSSKKE